jgi:transcriptional regulator with XRE-family HTH domain
MKKDPYLIKLGEQIRSIRLANGYSQEDCALKCGLDRSYYGAIERGEYNLTILNLLKIAKALHVDVLELIPRYK